MVRTPSLAIGIAACALVLSTMVAATPRQGATQQVPAKPADDSSHPVFVRLCTDCHDEAQAIASRRTSADWEDTIKKMIEKGATGSDKDFETVFDYLLRWYGKVYINTAKADELTKILGLSAKDANAIVAYRKDHGPFADFDAVKKVPDIDVKKLEEHKDAVAF